MHLQYFSLKDYSSEESKFGTLYQSTFNEQKHVCKEGQQVNGEGHFSASRVAHFLFSDNFSRPLRLQCCCVCGGGVCGSGVCVCDRVAIFHEQPVTFLALTVVN